MIVLWILGEELYDACLPLGQQAPAGPSAVTTVTDSLKPVHARRSTYIMRYRLGGGAGGAGLSVPTCRVSRLPCPLPIPYQLAPLRARDSNEIPTLSVKQALEHDWLHSLLGCRGDPQRGRALSCSCISFHSLLLYTNTLLLALAIGTYSR